MCLWHPTTCHHPYSIWYASTLTLLQVIVSSTIMHPWSRHIPSHPQDWLSVSIHVKSVIVEPHRISPVSSCIRSAGLSSSLLTASSSISMLLATWEWNWHLFTSYLWLLRDAYDDPKFIVSWRGTFYSSLHTIYVDCRMMLCTAGDIVISYHSTQTVT